jgi:uncharacterized protein
MVLDVRELLKTPGSRIECEVCFTLPEAEGLVLLSPVSGTIAVANSRRHLILTGRVGASASLECSRCLSPLDVPLEVDVEAACEIEYSEPGAGARLVPEEEDESLAVFGMGSVDLGELVRQELTIHLPLQSICRPDCRGICPRCGVNLNEETCRCPGGEPDPRLAVLRNLLDDRAEESL